MEGMMLNTEHVPHCKYCNWQIIDREDNEDYVCLMYGNKWTGYRLCYGDEKCRYYEPDTEDNK